MILLRESDYYTQRNNQFVLDGVITAAIACMPTARVMWYVANGIRFDWPTGEQPEDYFMRLLNSEEAVEFCHAKYPWTTNRRDASGNPLPDIRPNEVHGMYGSWLDERVTGKRRSNFLTTLKWGDYIKYIENGHAIMTAGRFPTTKGHAVAVVGKRDDDSALLLADPWGNYRTNYGDVVGYAVPMPESDFDAIINGDENGKWGHVPVDAEGL